MNRCGENIYNNLIAFLSPNVYFFHWNIFPLASINEEFQVQLCFISS